MSKPAHTIDIDRIILTDLDVTPERAERIRALIEIELQRLLDGQGVVDGLAGGELPYLPAPPLALSGQNNDLHLAGGLARSVAQSLRGLGD
jgi:hypothetical protein